MAIDYGLVRQTINELNQTAIRIGDILSIIESGTLFGIPCTQSQKDELVGKIKAEANDPKNIAGDIKQLVNG